MDPLHESDLEDGDTRFGGQAGGRVADAALPQRSGDRRGEGGELDQLAFAQLRVRWRPNGTGTVPAPAHLGGGPETRRGTAELRLTLADRGVRSVVLRLPPTVHGDGDNGFMATIVGIAREKGVSGYIGDGGNRWPAVHRLDAAHLFRLAVEKVPAGSTLHAVADEGVPIRDIAEVIGRHLSLPVVSIAPQDAAGHFTWLAQFLALDIPASSTLTRELTGWQPTQPGLIEDLEKGHYFNTQRSGLDGLHTRSCRFCCGRLLQLRHPQLRHLNLQRRPHPRRRAEQHPHRHPRLGNCSK